MTINMLFDSVRAVPMDTFQFMLAGFAVVVFVVGGYAISLWLRFRTLNRRLHMLEIAREQARSDDFHRET